MSTITIQIKFFGAFRQHGEGMDITVPAASTAGAVKTVLQEKLGSNLVSDSVLANDNRILRDEDLIESARVFSILPPVCGG